MAQQGFQLSPGITLASTYDDDLAAPGADALFTEVTPAVTLGYGTQRLSLLSHGALDIEAPDSAPFRTTPFLRGTADASLTALLTDRLTFSAGGSFWDTNTPRDLNVITGYDPGSLQANSESANAGLAYRITDLLRSSLEASFVSTAEGGLVTDEETARLGFHRQVSENSGWRIDLLGRRFEFVDQYAIDVEAPMADWDHRFSPELSAEVLAGPRFDRTSLEGVEGSASVLWQAEKVHVSFSLASTQTDIPGFVGLVDTESAALRLSLRPADKLYLSATPSIYVSSGSPLDAHVLELRIDAYRQLNDWLSLIASYRLTVQSAKYPTDSAQENSTHNQLLVGLSFQLPAPGLPIVWPTADTWTQTPVATGPEPAAWTGPLAPTSPGAATAPGAPTPDDPRVEPEELRAVPEVLP